MAFDIVPGNLWNFPAFRVPTLFSDDDEDWVSGTSNNVSLSEDDKQVYVSAALPGVDEKNIEITFNKGILWVKGEIHEEEQDKRKKFYRKATGKFSYRIAVPGDLDLSAEPTAEYKNGVMTVIFAKSPASQPKKILVKSSK